MQYFTAFLSCFVLAVVFTLIVKKIALKFDIVDYPNQERKIHKKPVPFLGGLAVFLSFALVLLYFTFNTNFIIGGFISLKHIIGILLAGSIIIIGGVLDDKYNLKPIQQIIFPALAVFVVVLSGVGIDHIRNPFGGIISFEQIELVFFSYHGLPYKITILADIFTLIWLMGMIYTTKLLDGLDGLVSGITIIGALIIFAISMSTKVAQPNTAFIAILLAGAFAGFLVFNWNPAKIFLGEGGSLLAGFLIGVLAIISGSKVATTLLILGVPILDVVCIIIWRLKEGKNPFKASDRKHLHFRLLDIGMSQRQAVVFLYCLTGLFGLLALFLQSYGKFIALIVLAIVMAMLLVILLFIYKKKKIHEIKSE